MLEFVSGLAGAERAQQKPSWASEADTKAMQSRRSISRFLNHERYTFMLIQKMRLNGLALIEPKVFSDERGWFFESYRRSRYADLGIDLEFVQDNVSFSKKNTLRGLHYQERPGQAKLVSVMRGSIWDVAVDIRLGSPTFGQWEAVELSDENFRQFFIPVGFAHGFVVLSDFARVQYKVSAPYDPAMERTILWNDPGFAIKWPVKNPILSDRDRNSQSFEVIR